LGIARGVARKHGGEDGEAKPDDMQQEAVFGLAKALHDFDPAAGTKFSTFAWARVEWWISDYLDKSRELRRHGSVDAIAASGNDEMLGLYAIKSRDPDEEKLFD
jgi:RNA polymerase sigma factor (sigma-70 family)